MAKILHLCYIYLSLDIPLQLAYVTIVELGVLTNFNYCGA